MNLQSDNKQSTPSALSKLKQTTALATQTVTETPYQPIVYAIPKEDFKALLEFMRATTDFQPELFEKFVDLEARVLTREDWNVLMGALNEWSNKMGREVMGAANSIVPRVQDLLKENKEALSQDGKKREQFFSRLNTETDNRMEAFSDMISEMKKWIMGLIAGTGIASVLLSAVICLLMR